MLYIDTENMKLYDNKEDYAKENDIKNTRDIKESKFMEINDCLEKYKTIAFSTRDSFGEGSIESDITMNAYHDMLRFIYKDGNGTMDGSSVVFNDKTK